VYNRYIPEDAAYRRIEVPLQTRNPVPNHRRQQSLPSLHDLLPGKESLSGLLKSLRLEGIDSGDILLLLIALFLWKEGDDPDLLIALGLVFLMGLGEEG